jgi:hypothetical protein
VRDFSPRTNRGRALVVLLNLTVVLGLYYWMSTWTVPGVDGVPTRLGPSPISSYLMITGVGLLAAAGALLWPSHLRPRSPMFPFFVIVLGITALRYVTWRYMPLAIAGTFACAAAALRLYSSTAAKKPD